MDTELLNELKTAIDALSAKVDQLSEKQQSFEDRITNEVINPANEAYEKSEKDKRFNNFKTKYGEKLAPYENDVKALEGDDMDIYQSTFDAMDGDDSIDPDSFIDSVTEALKTKIDEIKSKLGVAPDAEVTVTESEDGDIEVKADGETVAESESDTETKVEESTEEPKAEETETEEKADSEEPTEEKAEESEDVPVDYDGVSDEKELEELMKELDEYKD